jgi:thiol-disulfide isomerase/thioredoxin
MVTRLLSLKETPYADSADALAIAICHLHNARRISPALLKTKDRRLKTKDFFHAIYFFSLWSIICGLWSAPAFAGDWLEGANGYARGLDQSKTSGKPVILYFYTDWCPYCRKFEKHTLGNDSVKKILDAFVLVRINPEKGSRENQIAEQYRVDGYPSVFFSNPSSGEGTQEVTQAVRSADDFKRAASEFLKVTAVKNPPRDSAVLSAAVPMGKTPSMAVGAADHILHLKNGRKAEGVLVSENAKGVTLAMDELGEVYFSKSEYDQLEKIKA